MRPFFESKGLRVHNLDMFTSDPFEILSCLEMCLGLIIITVHILWLTAANPYMC
jgi:hypothetical protein